MRSLERHRNVGAYTLGVLDETDAFRFEDHLVECPRCAVQATGSGAVARQLMLYRSSAPRLVHPPAGPGPGVLDRLLSQVAARNHAGRRRLLPAPAASVVLAVTAPAVAMTARADGGGAVRIAAAGERSGVWARVITEDETWGSALELEVKDGAGPRTCRPVVIGRDGSEETVGGWSVSRHDARPTTIPGGSAMRPEDIARYAVRTAQDESLVTLMPR